MKCWRKGRTSPNASTTAPIRACRAVFLPGRRLGGSITTHDYKPRRSPEEGPPRLRSLFAGDGGRLGATALAFRRRWPAEAFDNVDVYPLLARLIGVKPQANDGKLADVAAALTR